MKWIATVCVFVVSVYWAWIAAQLVKGQNAMAETLDSIKQKLDGLRDAVTSKLAELKQAIDDEAAVIAAAGGDATKLEAIGAELTALNDAVAAVSPTPDPVTPPTV